MDFSKIKNFIFDALFPTKCLGCGKLLSGDKVLCPTCESEIEINSGFYCPRCGGRLPETKLTCHKEEKFVLAAITSYQINLVRELIHNFKYNNLKIAVETLDELIKKYIEKSFFINAAAKEQANRLNPNPPAFGNWHYILPIPLHQTRERERGFNQSLLIAEILSRRLNIPIVTHLKKVKKSLPQVEMKNYEEREKNIAGSFSLIDPNAIKSKNIIIVDDVFTSGATMREAVKTLKSAGAKKIIAFVIAKA
jgi:ComF family protein